MATALHRLRPDEYKTYGGLVLVSPRQTITVYGGGGDDRMLVRYGGIPAYHSEDRSEFRVASRHTVVILIEKR